MKQTLIITSFDGSTQAVICPAQGAICHSLKIQEQELLYWPEGLEPSAATEICGGLPFIFPVCGRLQGGSYSLDDQCYSMPIHGFAHAQKWRVIEHTRNVLIVLLVASKETKSLYPFEFGVCLKFQAVRNGLRIEVAIDNQSDVPMPFYGGFHPYYTLPKGCQFQANAIKGLAYNDALDDVLGEVPLLALPISAEDPALNERLFELGQNRTASLNFSNGDVLRQLTEGDLFRYLQVYSPPGEGFICLEPWLGYPNMLNHGNAPVLHPGESFVGAVSVVFNRSEIKS